MSMRRSVTASGKVWRGRTSRATVAALLLTSGALAGLPPAYAISPPTVDPGSVPPDGPPGPVAPMKQNTYCTERSEEHTSELQSQFHLVCRLLLEKKKNHSATSPPAAPRGSDCWRRVSA